MSRRFTELTVAVLLAVGSMLSAARAAQEPTTPGPQSLVGPTTLALQAVAAPAGGARLAVTSPAFPPNGAIPGKHSDYGEKVSPALKWSGVPASAKTLVLLMEDPDAKEPTPFVHWILYNLPATRQELAEGLPGLPKLLNLDGALQGRNSRGSIGYMGPRPPKPDPAHHYHVQVFALDAALDLDPNASRVKVLDAMKGHVVAAGDSVGTFKAPADAK